MSFGHISNHLLMYLGTAGWVPDKIDTDRTPKSVAAYLCLHFLGLSVRVLIVSGFNNTSALVGLFVSSPKEREKRDRTDSRGDKREGLGKKRKMKESDEREEITIFPPLPLPAARTAIISWAPRWRKLQDTFALPNHLTRLSESI